MKRKPTLSVADLGPIISVIRSRRVMLDSDLAMLYSVETKALKRAVKRNDERFPDDFMFPLTGEEFTNLRCQIGTSSSTYGGTRYLPLVFTKEGIAMLSSVLRSERAVEVNIAIMRAFVRLREMTLGIGELARKVETLERGFAKHGEHFKAVFDALRALMTPPADKPRRKMGFDARD
jgi:ORF6N domain